MMWDADGYWNNGWGWEGWVMFVFMIVFVVAVVVAVVFLLRYLALATGSAAGVSAQPPMAHPLPESPKDVLKRRYAAGEIDREEYLQILGDL